MPLCFNPLQASARNRWLPTTDLKSWFIRDLSWSVFPDWGHTFGDNSFVSPRRSTLVPSVQTYSRSFQTLCRNAKTKHSKLCRTRCTVERWRFGFWNKGSVTCSSLAVSVGFDTSAFLFRFCRSCWNITCKGEIKCFFFHSQPRWGLVCVGTWCLQERLWRCTVYCVRPVKSCNLFETTCIGSASMEELHFYIGKRVRRRLLKVVHGCPNWDRKGLEDIVFSWNLWVHKLGQFEFYR